MRSTVDDLELASLISSKICHDVINPVGAIYNGLEVLDDNADEDARAYALSVIRNFTEQASAKLQFARFAFGAAGSAGLSIDLANAETLSRGFLGESKHRLIWSAPQGQMAKDRVKLLLNMIAIAVTALPRGGDIVVGIAGPLTAPRIELRCRGHMARLPQHLTEFLNAPGRHTLDAMSIQAYYACRLAMAASMRLEVGMDGTDALIVASSLG